ncbi:MAG TPA: T9SS type A sorting domain-containing protein, partial [Candidatus Marinimicrobia bacterium]|nr:T9SS type A sorting domain-containing protein [Candidatus Neomarinimicrobiota bacterium]
VILLSTATAPTSQAVHEHSGVGIVAYGSDENLSAATEASLSISGLTASTDYSIYVVLEYNEELQSSPTRIDISTDVVAPAFASGYPAISNEGQTSFTLKVKAGEAGTAYYVVLADGATRPDTTKIKAGDDASGTDATASGKMTIAASVENTASITGLTAGISYDVWVTAEDANGNITTASKKDVTTLALPKKLTVKQDGSGDYPTISSAISAASSATADTVVVYAGTYQENVNFGGKNLVVRSDTGAENTIITPSNNGLAIVWFYSGEPSTAKLIGFTLKDGGALQGSALNIETSSSPTIENCIITNSKGYPVRFYNSASVIKNTLIYNNTGDGVFYFDNYTTTSYPEIINCTVANNTGYGIQNAKSYKPIAKNSIFYGNSSGGAFGNLDITYSIVEGTYTGTGNKDSDPLFKGSANASDYKLTDYSPAIGSATATGAPTTDLASTNRGSPPDIGAYENSLSTPLSDTYVPVVSHVREGSAGDLSFIGTQSQMSAHWNGSDEGSGISYYEYAVDTDNTNITGSVVAWTNAGTDTSVTITGLSLTEGTTYYVSVRAYDVVKNVSVVVTSNGVKVDITTPIAGIVVHGTDTGTHFYWTGNSSSITATWSGFSDAASGIKEYEVLLRDTLNNTNIVDWTNTGTALTKTFSELTLVNNGQYYFKVRASDLVGNLSQFAASGIVQVDTEKPVVTTLVETAEGSEEDIDWVGPGMNVIHRWKGQDNGQILHYEFSAGTSEGATNVIAWANVSLDTTDTTSSENYEEGLTYFTNVQAKDKADNLSDVLTSDGFQFDETPPKTGSVSDGASADIDFSGSESSITFNWTGFEDAGSGINHYMVALGTTPEGEDVLELKDVGDVTSETLSNLYLDHGVTYYCSVMAVDEVGNESDLVSSNGFTVDIYPGPPTVASSSPAGEVFLSLISESEIVFKFSEPVDYGDFDIWSDMSELTFSTSEDQDSIAFILTPPLTSLDTVYINLSNLTDLSGLTGEDTLFTFATELIADYNHDLVIDASDLSSLASGWMNEDYTYELGPVTGEAPHFVPQLDGDYDLRDVMAYTRMWHWYHETPKLLNLARANLGEELEVTVNDKSLAVTIPEHVIAGQLAFQMTGSEAIITLPAEKTGDMIVLSHVEEGLQQSLIDFAYLGGEGKRNFVLPLEFGRYSSTITVSYALYAEGGTIDRQGVKTMDITPVPVEFVLDQNYPNPFNPTTRIEYGLPVNGQVKLTVYDLLGQEVRTLIPGSDQIAGFHNIMWDARDERGVAVSAGVYIYRLAVRGEDGQKFSRTKKMVLLK